ncbi:MAG: Clp protease N-terminal domain-containing protein, partial [Planctomycetota bacterium]
MLDRFSENARQAMSGARRVAERQGSAALDVEHLLTALLALERSYARRLLAAVGVDVDALPEALAPLLPSDGAGAGGAPRRGGPPPPGG